MRDDPVTNLADIESAEPRIKRGYAYWQQQAGFRAMPTWAEIDPAAIAELLPYVVVTHVLRDPLDFVERIAGEIVLNNNASNRMHIPWTNIPERGPDSEIWQQFVEVIEGCQPTFRQVPYFGPHKEFMQVQVLRCPISDDGVGVNKVISFVNYTSRYT